MSDILTRIRITVGKKENYGICKWGRVEPEEMIRRFREHATHLRKECEAIENAKDEEFQIDVIRGSVVQRHVETLQKSIKEN